MSMQSIKSSRVIETVTLYQEYRLIEKQESEINAAWRGIHLLLFSMAFVFGSFCTFCFHMLMYLFGEKCVLFPKMISLKKSSSSSNYENKVFDYISSEHSEGLAVDFVATQWVEMRTCHLPMYVPLMSGICGLIWATMFLMCSSGSRTLTGLQRPWRVLPMVLVFSLAMGSLSIYASYITQTGLEELCSKFGEISGTPGCSYTVNIATLAYERQIRGIYQATRLTIVSAWLHTYCWIGAAFTAILRIVLVVDFSLVKVEVVLRGNIEKMLERHERHIKTDEFSNKDYHDSPHSSEESGSLKVRFMNKGFDTEPLVDTGTEVKVTPEKETALIMSTVSQEPSIMSLEPVESRKLYILKSLSKYPDKYHMIVTVLHEIVDKIGGESNLLSTVESIESDIRKPTKLKGQRDLRMLGAEHWSSSVSSGSEEDFNRVEAEQMAEIFRRHLKQKMSGKNAPTTVTLVDSQKELPVRKASLKTASVQTEEVKKQSLKVQISSPKASQTSIITLKPAEEQDWIMGNDPSDTPYKKGISYFIPFLSNEDTMPVPMRKIYDTTNVMTKREEQSQDQPKIKPEVTTKDSGKSVDDREAQKQEEPGPSQFKEEPVLSQTMEEQDKNKKSVIIKEPSKTGKKEKQD